jgi:molybdenum cofactor synthesis domain-containing protein
MGSASRKRAFVVTVSDGVSAGTRDDASGRALAALLEREGFELAGHEVVPDERPEIEALLRLLVGDGTPLVVTTGGTGFGPRDITPEATRAVIDREAPGLAEEMRASGRGQTPFAALSRGLVGSSGATLIVNLPGSEKGAVESLSSILPVLPHALDLLAGHTQHGPAEATPKHSHEEPGASIEAQLEARRRAGQPVVLATAVRTEGSPPCQVGQKILLGSSGAIAGTLGCAEFDDAAIGDAPGVLAGGKPATAIYTHELGSVEVFLEPFTPRPLLLVFSATPVARQLMRWAPDVGFEPLLVEPRPERLSEEDRRGGRSAASLEVLNVDAETAAVHTDHDSPFVVDSLADLLRSPARFVGVMGSARHVGPHLEELRRRGFSEEDLQRVRTPVGIDLGARTAEEIALSILAGVVADRHGAGGTWLDRGPKAILSQE